MVHYERYHQLKKGEVHLIDQEDDQESQSIVLVCSNHKRSRPKLLSLLFLSIISCTIIVAPQFFFLPSTFSLLYSLGPEDGGLVGGMDVNTSPCSSVSNGTMCCDRSSIRSDICIMKGDVRTQSSTSSIILYNPKNTNSLITYGEEDDEIGVEIQHEKVKPYTRKWESSTMATIDELNLISKKQSSGHWCDVQHDVPAVFFSTGGYTGNVYHEFNDGLVPLYITSQHYNKKVVFVILEYHTWWVTKYGDILSHLSDYAPIDFSGDKRTHCFTEAIVGLRIHDEIAVDSSKMVGKKSIRDFRNILDLAYFPRISDIIREEERELASNNSSINPIEVVTEDPSKPKLVIVSRNGSRSIQNEVLLVKMAKQMGFFVEVLRPEPTTELAKIYRSLNSSDVMIGVHGAAMTHFLFMRPGCVFIQVVPLGTDWAAETYYGEPAKKLGLKYIGYKILPKESSLYEDYDQNDAVLMDPDSVNSKGWEFTKKIYLDRQKVNLNLSRFRKRLARAYTYSVAKRNLLFDLQSQ